MDQLLPIIPISDLQRSAKAALAGVRDYAVIRSHHRDVAFVLHPRLGKALLESGLLAQLSAAADGEGAIAHELQGLIGNVLRELSKR